MRWRRAPDFDFAAFVRSHGSHFFSGDGNDVVTVHRVTSEALKAMQGDPIRPAVIEFETWRYYEHCGPGQDDHLGYREEEHITHWAKRDPIALARERLIAANPELEKELQAAERQFIQEIDSVIEKVRASARPDPVTLQNGVFAP
jgi:pyruvate dehydrogenase E1 component alpha subunit